MSLSTPHPDDAETTLCAGCQVASVPRPQSEEEWPRFCSEDCYLMMAERIDADLSAAAERWGL